MFTDFSISLELHLPSLETMREQTRTKFTPCCFLTSTVRFGYHAIMIEDMDAVQEGGVGIVPFVGSYNDDTA